MDASDLIQSYLLRWPWGYLNWRKTAKVLSERGKLVPLATFPWHKSLYDALDAHREIGVLKPRKEGVTTEAVALLLYLALYYGGHHLIYVSYNEKETFELEGSFRSRLELMYQTLQAEHPWQCALNPVTKKTTQEMVFNHLWTLNGQPVRPSSIFVTSATPNVGASADLSFAWLDEIHRYETPVKTWSAIVPSVENSGGPVVHTGTLFPEIDVGGFGQARFESLYYGRRKGAGLFIGYGARPNETEEAYAAQLADCQSPRDVEALHKLHPRTVDEALEITGGGLFTAEEIARCFRKVAPLAVPARLTEWAKEIQVWAEPVSGHHYVMGLDPKQGGPDPSALLVLDVSTEPWEEVVTFRGDALTPDLARLAHALHDGGYQVWKGSISPYRPIPGGLVPELEGSGLDLEMQRYFDLDYFYTQERAPTPKHQTPQPIKYGFQTTGATKPYLMASGQKAVAEGLVAWHNDFLAEESRYWRRERGIWSFTRQKTQPELGHGDISMAFNLAIVGAFAVLPWIQKIAVARMGPHEAPQVYYDWSHWLVPA